ncbi:MAG: TIGR03621 family F420-dependent LLM class oxidoreductase [Ilumatobacteraceae bacterium]
MPMRFSVQLPTAADGPSWLDKVKRAEDLGFDSVSVPDHLGPALPQLAPFVALAAASAVTTRIRLATTVIDNDFRHPVMLAKEVATLDVLSSGRVDLGIGAGWAPEDYSRTGIATFDSAGERVARLIESLDVVRRLLAGEEVTHTGANYQLDRYRSNPDPVQQPVPVMIGAGGRRMLTMAAQQADIISLIVQLGDTADRRRAAFEQQLRWIDEAGGRDRDDLTIGVRIFFGEIGAAGTSRRTVAERVASVHGMEIADVLASPFGLVGDPVAARDHLQEVHERYGINYFTLNEDLAWNAGPILADLASTGGQER